MRAQRLGHLDEGPLAELLVDLRLVHDVLGSAGILQRAQSLLHSQRHSSLANTLTLESSLTSLKISGFHLRKNRTHFQVGGGRRHGGDD